jgi:hypothetical protein
MSTTSTRFDDGPARTRSFQPRKALGSERRAPTAPAAVEGNLLASWR